VKILEKHMSPPGFSILGVVWPTRSLLDANQAGAQLLAHVVTVQQQLGINAGPGTPRVRNVGQAPPPRADGVKRVVHRLNRPNARQGVARVISAESGRRPVANAKQGALHNLFPLFYSL
jgi:hypothetical protein